MLWIRKNKQILAILVISILHFVGMIGLQTKFQKSFEELTFLNLFITFLLVLTASQSKRKALLTFFGIALTVGMLVEIIGVYTSFPFGSYHYTDVLRFKIFQVPLIIGINWFLLSYGILAVFQIYLKQLPIWIKSLFSALLMTFMDVLIEPFAIKHGLWVWANVAVPLQNYMAWFLISFGLFFIAYRILPNEKNKVAAFVILVFIIFFSINNLLSSLF